MQANRGISVKPLAAALTIALAAASTGASAGTPSNSTFAAQMQSFKNAVAQARQDYAQHPQQLKLLQKAPSHSVKFAKRHKQNVSAPAATVSVTSCVDNASSATTAGTLRYAVVNAVNGDVIDLSACNASTITLTQGALPVTVDDLSISAGAGNNVTIDGSGTDRVFYLTGPGTGTNNVLALSYLTIRNGNAPVITPLPPAPPYLVAAGGCIASKKDGIALYNSTVTGCKAVSPAGIAEGGGILAYGLYMYASTISNNVASAAKSGTSTANYYGAVGGGAIVQGPAYLYRSHIDGNSTIVSGGAEIAFGGGLFTTSSAQVYFSTVKNNSVRMNAGTTSSKYMALAGGLSIKYGGNIYASTVSGNSVTCSGGTTSPPNAFCLGGGVMNSLNPGGGAPLAVSYSTISGNHADFIGGAVLSKYTLNLAQSTISGNSALGGGGLVQKYVSGGSASISNSTIAVNTATYVGGGIFSYTSGPFSGSSTPPAPITLVSSIVAKNTGYNGAADDIYLPPGPYSLTIAGTNDLVMAASPNVTLPGGTLSADPMLGPLANNGGPTLTMGLLAGSTALGVGSNPNNYTNDQRGPGFPRTVGELTDIGAFQGTVAAAAAKIPAPTLSTWGLGLLAALVGWLGWRRTRAIAPRS
jgi:hypothetical protein